jgi:N-acetylglutamate synthase/N-acetylornithine aminotransferase
MSSINAVPDPQLGLLVTSGDNTATLVFQTNGTTALSIDSNQNANCTSTGAIKVPSGTTANKPTGSNGMIRYNTSISRLEGYINGTWSVIL